MIRLAWMQTDLVFFLYGGLMLGSAADGGPTIIHIGTETMSIILSLQEKGNMSNKNITQTRIFITLSQRCQVTQM